jgi:hypothetical protein
MNPAGPERRGIGGVDFDTIGRDDATKAGGARSDLEGICFGDLASIVTFIRWRKSCASMATARSAGRSRAVRSDQASMRAI